MAGREWTSTPHDPLLKFPGSVLAGESCDLFLCGASWRDSKPFNFANAQGDPQAKDCTERSDDLGFRVAVKLP